MRSRERRTPLAVFLTLLVGALCPLGLRAEQAIRLPNPGRIWRVKYLDGPITVTRGKKHTVAPLKQGANLRVSVSPQEIAFQNKKQVLLAIPVADVTEIAYDRETHRVSRAVVSGLGNMGGCGGPDIYACGAFVMGDLFVAAVALPFKYTNHYVRIVWQENGEEREIFLKIGKHDYRSFLAELQRGTAKPWKNLALEKANGRQALP
jgi:hypothetical protein